MPLPWFPLHALPLVRRRARRPRRLAPAVVRAAALAALAVAGIAATAAAQVAIVDEGSLSIYRGGSRVGREDFSIRTTSGPQESLVLAAQGNQLLDDRRLSAALSALGDGTAVSYQREAREPLERITLEVAGTRGVARTQTATAEGSAEFPVRERPVVLDPDVGHHIAILRRHTATGRVALLLPKAARTVGGRLTVVGGDTIAVAGRAIAATRVHLDVPGHPEAVRDAWFDAAGHVLRVVVPGLGLEYRRDDPPPEPAGGS